MEVKSYNAELAIANLQFKQLFNNIAIDRPQKNNETKRISVMCVLGQRSRIIKNWENSEKRASMKLPMIAVNRTGYSRNAERLNDLHNEVKHEMLGKKRSYDLLTPIPVDISYEVSIIAKNPSDIDQIASNFMIFFNSDAYVQCMHPKYEGLVMNNQVIMDDSVSEEHPDELDGSTDDLITTTFNFTFKTYLFGGCQKAKLVPDNIVSSYVSSFVSSFMTEIPASEIDAFQQANPYSSVQVLSSAQVTSQLTTLVPNPDVSSYVYDGFTPIVQTLCVGFYPVPCLSNATEHMAAVDQYTLSDQQFYVDRVVWKIDEPQNAISSTIIAY